MSSTCLLLVESHRLTAWTADSGELRLDESFPSTQEGHRRFDEFVTSHRHLRFRLIANLADESCVVETIPAIRGKDRQTLLARKLARQFPGVTLTRWESLGLEQGSRKNERILLAALGMPELLAPWLLPFDDPDYRLASIHSPSQFAGPLLRMLGEPNDCCLLLTHHSQQLRESFVVEGHTRFTRLVRCPEMTSDHLAVTCAEEAEKLRQYLVTQRQISPPEALRVVLVTFPHQDEAIGSAFAHYPNLSCRVITANEAAPKLRLPPSALQESSDAIFLFLLAKQPPRGQFAGTELRHGDRLTIARRILLNAATAILAASIVFSISQFESSRTKREEAVLVRAQATEAERRYREAASTFPKIGVTPENAKRLVEQHDRLLRAQRLPTSTWQKLSMALNRHPEISLTRLEWDFGQNFRSTADAAEITETTRLNATLTVADGNRQEIRRRFEQFVARLQAEPGWQVQVSRAPVEPHSLRDGGLPAAAHALPFVLEISQAISP